MAISPSSSSSPLQVPSAEALRWVREAGTMWGEDPSDTERLIILYDMLDSMSDRSSSPTEDGTSSSEDDVDVDASNGAQTNDKSTCAFTYVCVYIYTHI